MEEVIRAVLDEIGLQSSLAEIENRVEQVLHGKWEKAAEEELKDNIAKVWATFARGEQSYAECVRKTELWATLIWYGIGHEEDASERMLEGFSLYDAHQIQDAWNAWLKVANCKPLYWSKSPTRAYCCQIRKKVQKERNEVYDCRTYEGQPDRNMMLV